MKSSAIPISACSASSRARICAWIVTSSAVVGSSAIRSLRPAGERHRDHRPLALAARELVRIRVDAPLRLRDAGAREQPIARSRAALRPSRSCSAEHLDDLRADRMERIQRGHRLLEDHRDLAAAHRAHLRLAERAQVDAVEDDASRRARAVDEAEDRERRDRLARPGFADERELLAGADRERDAVDDRGRAEAHRQLLDRKERRRAHPCRPLVVQRTSSGRVARLGRGRLGRRTEQGTAGRALGLGVRRRRAKRPELGFQPCH